MSGACRFTAANISPRPNNSKKDSFNPANTLPITHQGGILSAAFPDAFLPTSLQTSRPDVVLLQIIHWDLPSLPFSGRRHHRINVHLVEVTYKNQTCVNTTSPGAGQAGLARRLCAGAVGIGLVQPLDRCPDPCICVGAHR